MQCESMKQTWQKAGQEQEQKHFGTHQQLTYWAIPEYVHMDMAVQIHDTPSHLMPELHNHKCKSAATLWYVCGFHLVPEGTRIFVNVLGRARI